MIAECNTKVQREMQKIGPVDQRSKINSHTGRFLIALMARALLRHLIVFTKLSANIPALKPQPLKI